ALNLFERQAQVAQRQDAVEFRQLRRAVIAIACEAIRMRRLQQADLVVIAQETIGDLCKSGKLTNGEHSCPPFYPLAWLSLAWPYALFRTDEPILNVDAT